nr:hypothetical protein CFP56_73144 [Quercus suber]
MVQCHPYGWVEIRRRIHIGVSDSHLIGARTQEARNSRSCTWREAMRPTVSSSIRVADEAKQWADRSLNVNKAA